MRIRPTISSLQELKKMPYELLSKTHDLEKGGKRRQRALEQDLKDRFFVVSMLRHLRSTVESGLTYVGNNSAEAAVEDYLSRFGTFVDVVERNCATSSPLDKGSVANLLTAHTDLFNTLLELDAGVEIRVDADAWHQAIWCALAIWGDDLTISRESLP